MHYWLEDNQRSIPCLFDGLKDCQRKILCTVLKKLTKETKLIIFSGTVISYSNYHHGETSLYNTIINMAQTHQNTNNIHYIEPVG